MRFIYITEQQTETERQIRDYLHERSMNESAGVRRREALFELTLTIFRNENSKTSTANQNKQTGRPTSSIHNRAHVECN